MPRKARPHQPPRPRQPRPQGHNAHYKTARWQRLRRLVLAGRPVCERCRCRAASHVDHVVALAAGGTDDPANLRALCHACHSAKTAGEDGGFGNPRKETR